MTEQWDDHPYRVADARMVTPVIREVWLAPDEAAMDFRPGQYVLLSDRDYAVPQRSYSVANAPRPDGHVSLLVTLVPDGPTSGWVHRDLQVGDPVLLSGPYGTFVLDDSTAPVLLMGAGSGLAPVRALAEALDDGMPGRSVTLVFSARTHVDTIDHDRFVDRAAGGETFRYVLALTRDPADRRHDRVPTILPRVVDDLKGWQVYAAGPPGFVTGCARAARELGAAAAAIHTEEFFADPQPWSGRLPEVPGLEAVIPELEEHPDQEERGPSSTGI